MNLLGALEVCICLAWKYVGDAAASCCFQCALETKGRCAKACGIWPKWVPTLYVDLTTRCFVPIVGKIFYLPHPLQCLSYRVIGSLRLVSVEAQWISLGGEAPLSLSVYSPLKYSVEIPVVYLFFNSMW